MIEKSKYWHNQLGKAFRSFSIDPLTSNNAIYQDTLTLTGKKYLIRKLFNKIKTETSKGNMISTHKSLRYLKNLSRKRQCFWKKYFTLFTVSTKSSISDVWQSWQKPFFCLSVKLLFLTKQYENDTVKNC